MLRGVSKVFVPGGPAVVDDVDLDVAPGGLVAVMGRSGSGKSTLLRCAAGLERPTSGTVTWRGRRIDDASPRMLARLRRSDFGVVHQDYNLLPALTVAENVELSARLGGRAPDLVRRREALSAVRLLGRERSRPAHLSGGEQQRVALARSLVVTAQAIFADEPTGALDAASRDEVLDLLDAVVRDGRRCVVLVTHDPWVAARAHRVVLLHDGRVAGQVESPSLADVIVLVASSDAAAV